MKKIALQNSPGFTMLELIVVLMILSSLCSLALIQLNRTVEKQRSTRAKANIISMHGALKTYESNHGTIYPNTLNDLASINTALGTSFLDDAFTYTYTPAGSNWQIVAQRANPAYTWTIDQDAVTDNHPVNTDNNPYCSPTANCP